MDLSKFIEDVKEKAGADTTANGEAHVQLLESIRKLNLAAETPAETLMRRRFEPLQSAAIRVALEAGVLHAIEEQGGKHISAADLAKKTGYDELLIVRVMRLVTFVDVCNEVGDGVYAATETTKLICTPGLSGGEKHHFDLFFPIGAKLVEYMRQTKIHQFPERPRQQSPFEYTHGSGFFEFFDKNKDQRAYLDDYMAVRRQGLVVWHQTFPMAAQLGPGARKDPDAVLLVDVGGGWGHDLQSFHKVHHDTPGRLILQDLGIIINRVNKESCPEDIETMEYNFFTSQPVKGARAYYFHNICHDWPDAESIQILSNTARSMEKGYSRILIDDYVLPNTGAPLRGSSMDFLMMMFCSGIERTVKQWEALLDNCGLEIVKIWKTRSDYESVIEAKLKE